MVINVMNKEDKKAFSIAEAVMSMIIISMVIVCTVPVFTKQKLSSQSAAGVRYSHGAFLCFYKNNKLYEKFCDGTCKFCKDKDTSCKDDAKVVKTCTFNPSNKISRYFILAAGAGGDTSAGQVKTEYVSSKLEQKIEMYAAKDRHDTDTYYIIDGSSKEDGTVLHGYSGNDTDFELLYKNVAGCRIASGGSCPVDKNYCKDQDENQTIHNNKWYPKSCKSVKISTKDESGEEKEEDYGIAVDGCECTTAGKIADEAIDDVGPYKFSNLTHTEPNRKDIDVLKNLRVRYDSIYTYAYKSKTTGKEMQFYLTLKDSNFNSVNTESSFSRILGTMLGSRSDDYIEENLLRNKNIGNPGQPGAVVILW